MKPTDEQKALFELCVNQYAAILNLKNWRIEVSDKPAAKGCFSDVSVSLPDRAACIRIGKDWQTKEITNKLIREIAVHEVLHVLLSEVISAASNRDTAATEAAEHSVILTLEKILAE